jgi:peptidoglycan/LPS O-acetylase OafA/YrhL
VVIDGAGAQSRLASLTGLRFVAAFLVFGFHVHITHLFANRSADRATGYIFGQGAIGVSFFFLLSGFVLTWSARPGDPARRFWRRRVAKVYPNHVVTAVGALFALAASGGALSLLTVFCNLLLVQAWVPQKTLYFGLNTPSWSLSCEMFFYLCFPLLIRAVDRLGAKRLWPATVLAMAAVCSMPLVSLALPAGLRDWFVFVAPPVRMLEFVIGILLARIVQTGRWIPYGVLPATGVAVVGYVVSGYLPGSFSDVAGTVIPLALLIPAVAVTDLRGSFSPLRSRVMVFLGETSYAFYMIHQLVIRFVEKAVGSHPRSTLAGVCLALGMLAVSLGSAWLLYRFVERPMMKRLAPRRAASRALAPMPPVANQAVAQSQP